MISCFFEPTPPTAYTDYRRYLIFCMHTLQRHTFGFIEAIFDICPRTQVLGVSWGYPKGGQKCQNFFFNFSTFFDWDGQIKMSTGYNNHQLCNHFCFWWCFAYFHTIKEYNFLVKTSAKFRKMIIWQDGGYFQVAYNLNWPFQ